MSPRCRPRSCTRPAGRAALALLAALAAYPSVSVAAPAPGRGVEAISGGGGFSDAPLLHAGTFTDTLLLRETLFYAVRLKAGQRLTVRAMVDLRGATKGRHREAKAAGGFALRVFTPLRQALTIENQLTTEVQGLQSDLQAWRTPRVVPTTQAIHEAERRDDWRGPGLYHVAATISAIFRDVGAIVECPLRLHIAIDDRAVAGVGADEAGSGPLDAPAGLADPIAAKAPTAPRARTEEQGRSTLVTAAAAGGGLLLGLLVAVGLLAAIRALRAS